MINSSDIKIRLIEINDTPAFFDLIEKTKTGWSGFSQ